MSDNLDDYLKCIDGVKGGLEDFVKQMETIDENFNAIRALALKT